MKVIGIVVEYNPFHNGHLYQIECVKKMYPNSVIVVVMSGCFTQRGDISVLTKWEKTEIAIYYGVDIVIELPTPFCIQSSDIFASGAIKILNNFKIDMLIFGSESDNLDKLMQIAKTQLFDVKFDNCVKEYIDKGCNYPTALNKSLIKTLGFSLSEPNDLLGVSYIKEILKINADIEVKLIKRTSDFNDLNSSEVIVSANNIRNKIMNNIDIKKYIPKLSYKYLKNKSVNYEKMFNMLKYKIITSKNTLNEYHLVSEGIENRIIKVINNSNNYEELVNKIKTKRYTFNRINRMLMCILIDYKTVDNNYLTSLPFCKILGMSNKGKNHYSSIKKNMSIRVINKYFRNEFLDFEVKVTSIYSLITNNSTLVSDEYKKHPIIY